MGDEEYTRIIHRFWDGKPMPEQYELYGWQWQDLNPGWQVVTWDEPKATCDLLGI